MKPNYYGIIHVQAPTDVSSATHPALLEDYGLIHNGILKPHYMKKYDYQTTWDTEWLLNHMLARGIEYQHFTSILDKVDGAFSCVLLKQRQYIWLFRNSIAPMYRNELDISSAKIDGFEETKYDTVYRLDISEGYVFPIAHFKNIERPYVGV
jgi:glutamine phosphoribosylpyrophosphate amidotransferase